MSAGMKMSPDTIRKLASAAAAQVTSHPDINITVGGSHASGPGAATDLVASIIESTFLAYSPQAQEGLAAQATLTLAEQFRRVMGAETCPVCGRTFEGIEGEDFRHHVADCVRPLDPGGQAVLGQAEVIATPEGQMLRDRVCEVEGCGRPGVVLFAGQDYCRFHWDEELERRR